MQGLFNSKAAAIVANVGTLIQPTDRNQYLAGATLPSNLFSHADQQLEWQNGSQSTATQTGWAGRIADLTTSSFNPNATIPMIVSAAGDTRFCDGATKSPVSVTPGNLGGSVCWDSPTECAAMQGTAQALLGFSSGLSLVQADNDITQSAYSYAQTLSDAVQSITPLKTQFPANNGLATQLKQIAQIIQVRAALGVSRQIFFAGIGSFDTHTNQLAQQGNLLASISPALAAFYQATQELQAQNEVTTFTMSDFSRTFEPNSNTGSDHGWGSHHLVIGGAVEGGQIYGQFPELAVGGPDDADTNGRWIPTTASIQYASTLAQWFGVNSSQLTSVFPNIGAFPTSYLGFLG